MSFLLSQINLIFKKMKLDKEFEMLVQNVASFRELRDMVNSASIKQINEEEIQNDILPKIFSRDINNIIPIISWQTNSVEVQFSLLRIYLNFFKKSPQWLGNPNPKVPDLDGKTMIFNLFRCYVETYEGNKDFLFKEENRFFFNI